MTIDTTDAVDAEIVETPAFTKTQAVQHNQKVQGAISAVNATGKAYDDAGAALTVLLAEARDGQIHVGLGLPSWTAYLEQYVRLEPRSIEDRRAMVAQMVEAGMSTRAIGPMLNVSHVTVSTDALALSNLTPDLIDSEPAEIDDTQPEPEPVPMVTGRDGVQQPRRKSKPPAKKTPPKNIANDFTKTLDTLATSIEELVKLSNDPKFAKSATIKKHREHLEKAHDLLQTVIDKLV
jgi:hypothetical protein